MHIFLFLLLLGIDDHPIVHIRQYFSLCSISPLTLKTEYLMLTGAREKLWLQVMLKKST